MAFASSLGPNTHVIDDDNYEDFVGEISVNGEMMSRGLEPRDWAADPFGSVAEPFNLPVIPRSEWDARIQEQEETKSSLDHLMDIYSIPVSNQNGTNFCWAHGVVRGVTITLAKQGQTYIELEPASVAAPINNYQNRGGWGVAALKYIIEHGVAPVSLWPKNYYRDDRYDTPECRAARANYKVHEWWEVQTRGQSATDIFDQIATLLLMNIPVPAGFAWWGHLICLVKLVKLADGRYGFLIDNSWGTGWGDKGRSVLSGSKAIPDDIAVAPRVSTAYQPIA